MAGPVRDSVFAGRGIAALPTRGDDALSQLDSVKGNVVSGVMERDEDEVNNGWGG